MIDKIIKKINSVSMKTGRFFCDKNYKFDTMYFGTGYLLDAADNSGQIDLSGIKKAALVSKFVKDLKLSKKASSQAANQNYLTETIALLEYSNAIKKVSTDLYQITDFEILEFISVSIENAYIFQYLLAYKTYKNDRVWDLYVDYVNCTNLVEKHKKLLALANLIKSFAQSVGANKTSPWSNLFVKYQIQVLGLANCDNSIARSLSIKADKIEPKELANIEGTRSTTVKNNSYINRFRKKYVLNTLKNYLATRREKFMPTLTKRTYKNIPLNLILYGAPGTGKTYSTSLIACSIIDKVQKNIEDIVSSQSSINRQTLMKKYNQLVADNRIVFTTFHQNYGYEDFVQGLRPDNDTDGIKFKNVDGIFKKISDTAINDPSNNYVLIVDEINRANISKVLGELITLLEDDKRWGEENQLSVTLPSGDVFAVPNNLYIVGTMNSADKSISLIDAALRRRFSFYEIAPDYNLIKDNTLKLVLNTINSNLGKELDSTDLLIGHAYFIDKTIDDLCDIMNLNIIPLLYEYFYDNKSKVKSVLSLALSNLNFEIVDDDSRRLKIKKTK